MNPAIIQKFSVLLLALIVFQTHLLGEAAYPGRDLREALEPVASIVQKGKMKPGEASRLASALLELQDPVEIDKTLVATLRELEKKNNWDAINALHDAFLNAGTERSTILAADVLLKAVDVAGGNAWSYSASDAPDSFLIRAANLMNDNDPLVQAMGEWTIDLWLDRDLAAENQLKKVFEPDAADQAWYAPWEARPATLFLQDDYMRQLVNVNRHRDLASLRTEIEKQARRMKDTVAASKSMPAENLQNDYQVALEAVRLAAQDGGNLAEAHRAYIAFRMAGREVLVAIRPEFPTEGFVFMTGSEVPGGSNNVNMAVVGADLPMGDIYLKRSIDPAIPAQSILGDQLGQGSLQGIDLSWESDKLLFSFWSKPGDSGGHDKKNAWIYEMDLATGGLKTITRPVGSNDVEPIFLPNGDYMFASDRSSFGNQCAGAFLQDKRCTTLYRLDGSLEKPAIAISNNKDFDRHPVVLNDGTVAFLHWEYQERHFYNLHTVWRCRPDGTNMDAFYKQHINIPMSIRTVRPIPDSNLCVATAQGHHDGHQGPIVLFDATKGVNNEKAMVNVTPGTSPIEGGYGPLEEQIVAEGGVENGGGFYINPFPVSDKAFLAGHEMSGDSAGFALYYVDVWGNRELIHRDRELSCFQPFALRERKRPPLVADTVNPEADHATVFVENVYRDLPGVEAGAVKHLRISQRLFLPSPVYEGEYNDINHLHYLPGVSTGAHFSYWNWAPTRTVGIVDVEEDGSAFFKVPAGTPIFLQALDENYLEVRRMRTSFTMQRGEFRGCVGCHETKSISAGSLVNFPASTMRKGPQTPEPPSWGENTVMDYQEHIQPILEKHCVECHGQENPEGGLEFTSREIGGFMQSYRTMFGLGPKDPTPIREVDYHKPLHPNIESFPLVTGRDADRMNSKMQENEYPGMLVSISNRHDNADITMPYQFGSTQSKLIQTLLNDETHREEVKAKMTEDEWLALVTWVDHNAIYHGTVIDKSQYGEDGSLQRVRFLLPSPWKPTDTCPSFFNDAVVADSAVEK